MGLFGKRQAQPLAPVLDTGKMWRDEADTVIQMLSAMAEASLVYSGIFREAIATDADVAPERYADIERARRTFLEVHDQTLERLQTWQSNCAPGPGVPDPYEMRFGAVSTLLEWAYRAVVLEFTCWDLLMFFPDESEQLGVTAAASAAIGKGVDWYNNATALAIRVVRTNEPHGAALIAAQTEQVYKPAKDLIKQVAPLLSDARARALRLAK